MQVRCPTLLVRGSESALLTPGAAEAFVAQVPSARFLEIPDSGHHVLVDQPDRLLAAIEDFLARVPDSGPGSPPHFPSD